MLAPAPDILLLDEPTNHLDLTTIEWLERELDARRTALVIISHDRRFLSTLSRSTVWLDRGQTRRLERGFADFEEWRDAVLAEEEREQHKLDRKIVAEEHWMRYGVTARRKRNVRRRRPVAGAAGAAPHAIARAAGNAAITASAAAPSGALVIEAERHRQELRRPPDRARLLDPHPARRPHRHRRAERQRQDHAGQHADRRACRRTRARCGSASISRSPRSTSIATASIPTSPSRDALTGGSGDTVMVDGQRQARRQLHEGFSVRAASRRARRSASCRAASAAG